MKLAGFGDVLISRSLKHLNGIDSRVVWRVAGTAPEAILETNLVFKNYGTTWSFLNECQRFSHALRHHPTITTTYNNVNLRITTHDAGNRLTEKDFELARQLSSSPTLDNLKTNR